MNKALLALTLLCGFLLGVVAGPWLWPRDLLQAPAEPAPVQAAVVPEPVPPPPPPEPPPPPPPPEPELVLKGVFVGADASRSRALIAQGDEDARLYKPDDKLPNGAVLRAVGNKSVEIEKNGETLTLPLERGRPGAVATETVPPAEPVATEPSAAADASAPAAAETTPP